MESIKYPPFAEITYHADLKAVHVKWLKLHMKLTEFEEIANHAFGILKENGGYVWIADMYDSQGVFPKDIMSYISSDETTAASMAMGLKWALTIMPKAAGLSSLSTKSWNKDVKSKDAFVVEQFPSWYACTDWIKAQQSRLEGE